MTVQPDLGMLPIPVVVYEERPSAGHRKATELTLRRCPPAEARRGIKLWHSRLPQTQRGPWTYGFAADLDGVTYATALWLNPSARMLPNEWLELRRLAVAPDAPRHTASWMLGAMRKWIRRNRPECPRLISYQDMDVHTGTIYKAAGWLVGHIQPPTVRDRTANRVGTTRLYRSSLNGADPDVAGKIRWEVQP